MTFHEKVEALRAALDAWGKEAPPTVEGEILLGGAASDLLAFLDDLTPPDGDHRALVVWVPKPGDEAMWCSEMCRLFTGRKPKDESEPKCWLWLHAKPHGGNAWPKPGPGCPWEVEK